MNQLSFDLPGCQVLALCSFFVQGQTTTERIVHIDAQLEHQNYEHFKRLVLSSPDSEVEYLEGFEFDWGYTYTVSVLETQLAYPLSDGTRYTYTSLRSPRRRCPTPAASNCSWPLPYTMTETPLWSPPRTKAFKW